MVCYTKVEELGQSLRWATATTTRATRSPSSSQLGGLKINLCPPPGVTPPPRPSCNQDRSSGGVIPAEIAGS